MFKNFWYYLLAMCMSMVAMIICLGLNLFFHLPWTSEIGFGFVMAGTGFFILIIFKMRKLFSGEGTSEKTWRSYK